MLNQVLKIADEAGALLLEKKKIIKKLKPSYKKNEGLVSEADLQSEELVRTRLSKLTPGYFILGEEDSSVNKQNFQLAKEADWVWHVDPLDGTNNFLNNWDYYAVSIALTYKNELRLGVVYAPEKQEFYFAEKGKGAFLKVPGKAKQQLLAKNHAKKDFDRSFFVTCLNSLGGKNKKKLDVFFKVNNEALSVRRVGAAALDLCLTARGVFDGFWEHGLKPWDINAGALVCKEAGLKVSDFWGEKYHPYTETIVAVQKHLADQLYQLIEPSFPSRP